MANATSDLLWCLLELPQNRRKRFALQKSDWVNTALISLHQNSAPHIPALGSKNSLPFPTM